MVRQAHLVGGKVNKLANLALPKLLLALEVYRRQFEMHIALYSNSLACNTGKPQTKISKGLTTYHVHKLLQHLLRILGGISPIGLQVPEEQNVTHVNTVSAGTDSLCYTHQK